MAMRDGSVMSGCYPDGCVQSDIDRACQGDNCGIREHGEMNMNRTCDACEEARLAYWQEHSELFEPPRSDYYGD